MSTCTYFANTSGNTATLSIVGNGSYVNCGRARKFLQELTMRNRKTDLVVDFSRCTALDSTLLGLMTRAALDLSERTPPGRVIFANLEGRNLDVVKNLGLHHIAEVTETPVRPSPDAGIELDPLLCESLGILRAHEALVEAYPDNAVKFRDVIAAFSAGA